MLWLALILAVTALATVIGVDVYNFWKVRQ